MYMYMLSYKKRDFLLNLKLFVGVVKFETHEEKWRTVHLHLKPVLKGRRQVSVEAFKRW